MYQEYQPYPELTPFIDKFWVFKGNTEVGTQFRILPDGCMDFIFSIGHVTHPANSMQPIMQPYRSFFVGAMTKYSSLVARTDTLHMLGVRFVPSGLAAFTRLPLGEFANLRVSASDVKILFDDDFAEMLCEQTTDRERMQTIQSFLLHRLKNMFPVDPQIRKAIGVIQQSHGQMAVRQWIDQICMCPRHFERKFKDATGHTPKEFSRIVKFQWAINLLRNSTYPNLARMAAVCGYYDQSHFIKDFRQLSGDAPSFFLSLPVAADQPLTYTV